MSDLQAGAISRQVLTGPDASRGGGGSGREQHRQERERQPRPGAEELAVALAAAWRPGMEAHYELDEDGTPRIRIVDVERSETVAVLTPEELQTLAGSTGLPPGLLVRTAL